MKERTEALAEIPCNRSLLTAVYNRQYEELQQLRRYIFSLLPLGNTGSIFEPGCGTGLLGRELMSLTDASYTGMDIDSGILPDEAVFVHGDALLEPMNADLYVTSFFFSSVSDPCNWLVRVFACIPPGGLFAVFCEYDYEATVIEPDLGLKDSLIKGLQASGLYTGNGGRLNESFRRAGFEKRIGGTAKVTSKEPDRCFLEMHAGPVSRRLPEIAWRVVWGIWRRPGH